MKRSLKWIMAVGSLLIAGRLDAQETLLLSDVNRITSRTNINDQVALGLTWLAEAKPATNPLGVQTKDLAPEFAGYVGIQESGVLLHDVPADCAGFTGGLRVFDIVLNADGQKFESAKTFDEYMASKGDSDVLLNVFRKGEKKELKIHVPAVANIQNIRWVEGARNGVGLSTFVAQRIYKLGIVSSPVDDVLRSHLNLPAGEGLVLTDVTAESAAAKVGCEVNDVLIELNGKRITSDEKLREQLQEIGDREVPLKLLRRGKNIEVKIQPKLVEQDQSLLNPLSISYGLVTQRDQPNLGSLYFFDRLSVQNQAKGTEIEQVRALKVAVGNLEKLVHELEATLVQQVNSEKPLSDSTVKPE